MCKSQIDRMFRVSSITIGAQQSLRVFLGSSEGADGPVDGFAITADLAASLGLVTSTVRGEISKHSLGSLQGIPELKSWLVQNDIIPQNIGKVNFADSALLLKVMKRHLTKDAYELVKGNLNDEIKKGVAIDAIDAIEVEEVEEQDPVDSDSDSDVVAAHKRGPTSVVESIESGSGSSSKRKSIVATRMEDEDVLAFEKELEMACSQNYDGEGKESRRYQDDLYGPVVFGACDDDGEDQGNQDEVVVRGDQDEEFVAPESLQLSSKDEDSSFQGSGSVAKSRGNSSSSNSSGSGSSSDSDDVPDVLPDGVSDLVLTVPQIPSDFSASDFTKAHSLKSYNIGRRLKKQLKKLQRWWTNEKNSERKGKAVSPTTAEKREERLLCFLGFVDRYRAVPKTFELTVGLVLNHRLVEAYCDYMTTVRKSSFGNLSETMTGLISCARWLYRKHKDTVEPQIIRRYKDWRNLYQSKAARIRKGDDIEELTERGKWLSWEDFVALIRRLRREWISLAVQPVTIRTARKLHDLLLLGLYR
jgi:hypothetical protein